MSKENESITVCLYGEVKTYTRKKARAMLIDCMANSEGSERDRYTTCYLQLEEGLVSVSDE